MNEILTSYTLKPLSDFYDWIMPDIPGYTKEVIDQSIRSAARDLLRQSRMWRLTLDAITTVASEPFYEIDAPSGALVEELQAVKLDGKTLTPASEADLKKDDVDWDALEGTPENYLLYEQNVIRLAPMPSAGGGKLEMEGTLIPTISATTLPSFLLDRYAEVIAMGAKSKLMLMQKKPWTNADLGVALRSEFETECARAGWRVAKGQSRAPLRVSVVHK